MNNLHIIQEGLSKYLSCTCACFHSFIVFKFITLLDMQGQNQIHTFLAFCVPFVNKRRLKIAYFISCIQYLA